MLLIPDKPRYRLAARKTSALPVLVLDNPASKIVRHADIYRAALLAGEHIDVTGHSLKLGARNLSGQSTVKAALRSQGEPAATQPS